MSAAGHEGTRVPPGSRVFVTGGSGFVGGAVFSAFAGRYELSAMARSESAAAKVKARGAAPVSCSLDHVTAAHLAGVDAVVHAAAYVEEWGPWSAFYGANVEGTRRLLAAAKAAGVRRFVHIGTEAALFRGQSMLRVDETAPLALDSPFPYSRSKAMAEREVRSANGEGMTTIILRPRAIWGPGDETILPAVRKMVDAGKFKWIGGGHYRTSTTHVANLVHAIELALTRGWGAQAYFVLDDGEQDLRDFFVRYLRTAGVELPSDEVPREVVRFAARVLEPIHEVFDLGPPPITRFAANMMSVDCVLVDDLARKELGYRPVVSVEEGLAALASPK